MFNDWRLKKGPIVPNKATKDEDLTLEHIKEDQTCPIMIQKLNYIFARKPLISSEI